MDKELMDRIERLEKSIELMRVCLLQTKPVVEEYYRKKDEDSGVSYV